MRIFISGGCKNGKSSHAERMAKVMQAADKPLYYIATMLPADGEDLERIARHQDSRRGLGFTTVEQPRDIDGLIGRCDPDASFLLDSVTALLANEMFLSDGQIYEDAAEKVIGDCVSLLSQCKNIVFVSDYIYSDAVQYKGLTELYRRSLACVDRALAAACDTVIEVCCGNLIYHKGTPL